MLMRRLDVGVSADVVELFHDAQVGQHAGRHSVCRWDACVALCGWAREGIIASRLVRLRLPGSRFASQSQRSLYASSHVCLVTVV